jgi:hypothetical protein
MTNGGVNATQHWYDAFQLFFVRERAHPLRVERALTMPSDRCNTHLRQMKFLSQMVDLKQPNCITAVSAHSHVNAANHALSAIVRCSAELGESAPVTQIALAQRG